MQWLFGTPADSKSAAGAAAPATAVAVAGEPAAGDMVEYFSASQNNWILAKVVARRDDGLYDLDCKTMVPKDKIRACQSTAVGSAASLGPPPVAAAAGTEAFGVGTIVEYYSDSKGGWIGATVQHYNPATGTYNLDCKPNVPASKIRKAPAGAYTAPVAAPGSQSEMPRTQWTTNTAVETAAAPQSEMPPTAPNCPSPPPAAAASSSSSSPPPVPAASSTSSPWRPAPASSGVTGAAPSQDEPLQLIRVFQQGGDWKFEVREEAAKVLEAYGQRKVAVCTVCGPYRTGKSYLLNLLLGRIQRGESQFRVGSTTRACTDGLWMWGKKEQVSSDGTVLIFMDCEGFGSTDSDKTRDAKLMSLCLLLSSVFLLNTKGVLSEGLFNALSLVCHLAQHVEERGREASKPALLWLLRDFVLDLHDESGATITADGYLEQSLAAQPLAGHDAERARAAREVRESLKKFFPQRHCSTLVQPIIDEEKLQRLSELPYSELRPEFRQQLEAMQTMVVDLAQKYPKMVAGQAIGGAALVMMLRKLVESVNSDKALNIKSAWDGVQHSACTSLVEELRETAIDQLRKVANGGPLPPPGSEILPVRDEALLEAIKSARRALRTEFGARAVGDEVVRTEYWRELKESIQTDEQAVQRQNKRLAEEQLRQAAASWEAWINAETECSPTDAGAEALLKLIDKGMPGVPVSIVAREALNTARLSRLKWDSRMGTLKAENQMLTNELQSKREAAAVAASTSAKDGDQAREQTREIGRLQGQVETLQTKVDAQDKMLKEQVAKHDEERHALQAKHDEVYEKCVEHVGRIKEMSKKQKEMEAEKAEKVDEEAEEAQKGQAGKGQPKCGCVVM